MVEANNENIFLKKTKAVFNMKIVRFVLLTIIGMLIVLALTMVILGNIAYWHYHHYAYFYAEGQMGKYVTPAALCIFVGSVMFVFSGFGCYGSLKNSTCAVNTYAAILSFLFIIELVALGVAYTFDRASIWVNFAIPVWGISDSEIRTEIDYIQSSLKCCGNAYFTDYLNVEFPSEMATVKVSMNEQILLLPASCCISSTQAGGYCANIWLAGCKYNLLHEMEHNVVMIGVTFACVMVINLLGLIFALLLAYSIRKMKSEKALLRWQIQEAMIMGRDPEASSNQLEAGPSRQDEAGPSRQDEAGPSRQDEAGPSRRDEADLKPQAGLEETSSSRRQINHVTILDHHTVSASEV